MGDRERGSNAPSTKGRGSNAPAAKRGGSNASTPSLDLDWAEVMNAEDETMATDGDNTLPTTGGRGGVRGGGRGGENSKLERSQSFNRTEEQVPAKKGGGVRGGSRISG